MFIFRRGRMVETIKRNTATVREIVKNGVTVVTLVKEMNTPAKIAIGIVVKDARNDMMTITGTASMKELSRIYTKNP